MEQSAAYAYLIGRNVSVFTRRASYASCHWPHTITTYQRIHVDGFGTASASYIARRPRPTVGTGSFDNHTTRIARSLIVTAKLNRSTLIDGLGGRFWALVRHVDPAA